MTKKINDTITQIVRSTLKSPNWPPPPFLPLYVCGPFLAARKKGRNHGKVVLGFDFCE